MREGVYEQIPEMIRAVIIEKKSFLLIECAKGCYKIIPTDTRDRDDVRAYVTACGMVVESVIAKRQHNFVLPKLDDTIEVVRV